MHVRNTAIRVLLYRSFYSGGWVVPVARYNACESLGADGKNQYWQYAEKCRLLLLCR